MLVITFTLVVELMFDYITVSIFYLRLIVQNVILIFMLFIFIKLYKLVIFYNVGKKIIPSPINFITIFEIT